MHDSKERPCRGSNQLANSHSAINQSPLLLLCAATDVQRVLSRMHSLMKPHHHTERFDVR
jgi:hypothetical protein